MNETTELAKTDAAPSALAAMAIRLQVSQDRLMDTLKATVFKKCSNEEFTALVIVSQTYELNPLLKEIYAFPAKGGGIQPIVGYDGWVKIITRHPQYDGMKVKVSEDGSSATCKIYMKNQTHPTEVTEYTDECKRNTDPWKQMPRRMIRNKAVIQCGRLACGISGIQDEDEAQDTMRNATPPQKTVALREDYVAPNAPKTEPEAVEVTSEAFIERGEPKDQPEGTQERSGMITDVVILKEEKFILYTCTINTGEKIITAKTFSSRVGKNAVFLRDKHSRLFLCINKKDNQAIDLIDVQPAKESLI